MAHSVVCSERTHGVFYKQQALFHFTKWKCGAGQNILMFSLQDNCETVY